MTTVLSSPIDITAEITDTLEEGKKFQILEPRILPVHVAGKHVYCAWLREHGTKRLYAVAFTGEMPDCENFIVKNGRARKTDPMPMP